MWNTAAVGFGGATKARVSGKRARPDIAIHRRGDESPAGNLLVAEFKNHEHNFLDWSSEDGTKVIDIQAQFRYTVGARVSFGPGATVRGGRILWRTLGGVCSTPETIALV
jgi:hypothetical protein